MQLTIRRPGPHEVDLVRTISHSVYPERPEAAAFWQALAGEQACGGSSAGYVAVADSAVVGYVSLGPEPGFPAHLRYGRLTLGVAGAHRRRGIGSRLLDHMLAEAGGYTQLRVRLKDAETEALAFLERRGFRVHQRMLHLVQDLAALPDLVRRPLPEGITLITLQAELEEQPDPLPAIHDLQNACFADIPSADIFTPPPYESFLQVVGDPAVLRDCFFLAKAGARYVGLSYAAQVPGQPGVLGHRFTGVHPDYRSRGIATCLKHAVTDYARSYGYQRVTTATLQANRLMRAVNEAMGFGPEYTEVRLVRDLTRTQVFP